MREPCSGEGNFRINEMLDGRRRALGRDIRTKEQPEAQPEEESQCRPMKSCRGRVSEEMAEWLPRKRLHNIVPWLGQCNTIAQRADEEPVEVILAVADEFKFSQP